MENTENVTPDLVNQDDTDNNYDWNEPNIPKTEFDKRIGRARAETETWKTKAQELEAQVNEARIEGEKKVAIVQYGEEIVNDPKVQEYLTKYQGMGYEEAVKLAGKEPKKQGGMFVARNPSNILNEGKQTISASELEKLPQSQRFEYRARAKKGEITIDYNS